MLVFNGNPERHKHEPLHLPMPGLTLRRRLPNSSSSQAIYNQPTPGVPHMIRRCSWIHLVKLPLRCVQDDPTDQLLCLSVGKLNKLRRNPAKYPPSMEGSPYKVYPPLGFGALDYMFNWFFLSCHEDISPELVDKDPLPLYFRTFSRPYECVSKIGISNSKWFPLYMSRFIISTWFLDWESRILTHHSHRAGPLPTSLQCLAQLNLHPCSCDGCPGPPALTSLFC